MKQKYKITENLSDHPTYTGQELTIDLNLGNDYYELVDIDGNRFMAGEEELTKIAIPSTPVNDKQEQTETVEGLQDLLKTIYHEIDICCISETSNVTMEAVRNILIKHGANEPDLW